jgi:3-hydroxybutyryl-CoA dehydrogenase
MEIANVFVVGAGYMGNGIAQVAASAGYRVKMCDLSDQCLESGLDAVKSSLGKFLSKEKITSGQYDAALANLTTTCDLEEARDADIAVEAVPENLELKKSVFARLDGICPSHTILATNTSCLPITSIASAVSLPERVVGTHFFGPVPLMRLCEVIKGLLTSQDSAAAAAAWVESMGKEPVLVRKDHAGFIANRVNIPSSIEAVRMVDEGIATPEDIDRSSGGFEAGVGPMQIMDNAGLDVCFNAAMAIYDDTRDPKFFPPPLLRRMVAAGHKGRKTKKGFYDYKSGKRQSYWPKGGDRAGESEDERKARYAHLLQRFILPAILEAVRVLEGGVGSAEDIDKASRLGFNFPLGQLEMADNIGLDTVIKTAMDLHEETADPKFLPPPLLRRMVAAGQRTFRASPAMGNF